jgi:hypothetical protein
MNALPTSAGLKMFFPKPPKTILPKTTPKIIPTAAIQKGSAGGIIIAKSIFVTKTDDETCWLYFFAKAYSDKNPAM